MLFPSTLVISNKLESIDKILQDLGHDKITNNPDILVISEYSIESIRSIDLFLSRSPYNHQNKVVIIPSADLLNSESQNALLKNLEEPGPNNYIILLSVLPNSLISTIVSRCKVIRLTPTASTDFNEPLIFPSLITDSLSISDSLPKDKVELMSYLNSQISAYQQQLIHKPSPTVSQRINKLIKATKMLQANVDPKSTTDLLLLS